MSDMVKQAGIISTADFLRLVVKTIIGIVLARILTQTDYGTYRQLFMIYTLLFSIFMIGLPQSIYYFIPRSDQETQKRLLRQTLDIFTILGFFCSSILIIFHTSLGSLFHNPKLPKVLLIYSSYPFFMFITQLYYTVMISMQQIRKAAFFIMLSIVCDLVLVLGIALITGSLKYIIAGLVISVLIQWFYARLKLQPLCKGGRLFSFNKELLYGQLAYSLPIGISSIIGVISSQLDKLLVSSYFSPEQFAIFSIGAVELPFIMIITNSVNAVILPEMNKSDKQSRVSELYRGAVRKNALLLFPLFAICFIFAPHIIEILYSKKYLSAVPFFRIYLLSMPLRIATYSILFQVYNRTKYIFTISGITLILNLTMSFIFIKYIGIMGPAISTIIVTYITVLLYLYLIKSRLGIRLSDLFPFQALFKTTIAVVLSGILSYFVLFINVSLYWQFATGSVLFMLLYYILGNAFSAILPYDNATVKSLIIEMARKLRAIV